MTTVFADRILVILGLSFFIKKSKGIFLTPPPQLHARDPVFVSGGVFRGKHFVTDYSA